MASLPPTESRTPNATGTKQKRQTTTRLLNQSYDQLRVLAQNQLRYLRPGHTLDTVALVHEAYLKVGRAERRYWKQREHFLAVMALAMRQILLDKARRRRALKRGGSRALAVTLTGSALVLDGGQTQRLDLEAGLSYLNSLNPLLYQVVELRFFQGLTVEETAGLLDISTRTVERSWYKAKALLRLFMKDTSPDV